MDICSIVSISSLSFKIYRKYFLTVYIPILRGTVDNFIRSSYLGGATDLYQAVCKNLRYYDVNSLYALAMTKPMPYKLLGFIPKIESLDSFFGFCLAEIHCPKNIRPVLPLKVNDSTLHPTGS